MAWLINTARRKRVRTGTPEAEYSRTTRKFLHEGCTELPGCSISRIHVGSGFQTDRQWNNIIIMLMGVSVEEYYYSTSMTV